MRGLKSHKIAQTAFTRVLVNDAGAIANSKNHVLHLKDVCGWSFGALFIGPKCACETPHSVPIRAFFGCHFS